MPTANIPPIEELGDTVRRGDLNPGEWSWPVQLKVVDGQVLIRPLHLQSSLTNEYVIDHESEPEHKITYSSDYD